MNLFWGIIIATQLVSLVFMGLALLRYVTFKRRNNIIENKYSLLFGFIRMEHIVAAYAGFVLLYTFGSVMMVFYLTSL